MNRLPDWLPRLQRLMARRWRQPFEWGVNDCATLACDAVLAMTGVDLATDLRGRYGSREEARGILGVTFEDYCVRIASEHGLVEAPWRELHRGDLGFLDTQDGGALGIVWPEGKLAFPGARQAELVPVRMAHRGWRIG